MLQAMDRVVMVASKPAAAAAGWEQFLDAMPAGNSRRPALGAMAHYWRLGDGWVEILEPEGDGVVSRALAARGPHLFAGGFTTRDVHAFAEHLDARGVEPLWDEERLVLDSAATGIQGLRIVVGPHAPERPVGLIDTFYELTDLVDDAAAESARAAEVLGLDRSAFQPIESEQYGYRGELTLFNPDRLDRLELITPTREGTTMERFHRRVGSGLYMAFAETGRLDEIERRVREAGVGHTAEPAPGQRDALGIHTLFLHPETLGGMMLGLSRLSYAWTWSGQPERVKLP